MARTGNQVLFYYCRIKLVSLEVSLLYDTISSVKSKLRCQDESAEFGSGVLGGKSPVDGGASLISLRLTVTDVSLQGRFIRMAPFEAGPGQYAEFYLRHFEPTPMLRCVVKLKTPGDSPASSGGNAS